MTTQRTRRQASVREEAVDDAFFIAQNAGVKETTRISTQGLSSDDPTLGGEVEHSRAGTLIMWKPSPQGYFPRTVDRNAISQLLSQGWKQHCPECGGDHSADPNTCPNREPIAVTRCPVPGCRKRIYDNMALSIEEEGDEDDPNMIRFDQYENSTPQSRLQLQLNFHMWTRHPQQAMMRGVAPLPSALREIVEASRPV